MECNNSAQEGAASCRNSHDLVVSKPREHSEHEAVLRNPFGSHGDQLCKREKGQTLSTQVDHYLVGAAAHSSGPDRRWIRPGHSLPVLPGAGA